MQVCSSLSRNQHLTGLCVVQLWWRARKRHLTLSTESTIVTAITSSQLTCKNYRQRAIRCKYMLNPRLKVASERLIKTIWGVNKQLLSPTTLYQHPVGVSLALRYHRVCMANLILEPICRSGKHTIAMLALDSSLLSPLTSPMCKRSTSRLTHRQLKSLPQSSTSLSIKLTIKGMRARTSISWSIDKTSWHRAKW